MCHNLQNYDSHLVFQEIRKYNFEINVMPRTVEKYMSFTIQQPKWEGTKPGLPLVFIDSDHFLNNSLDTLVKNVGNNDFYHRSKEFNANVLDLLKKKGFFPCDHGNSSDDDYWESFEKIKERLPSKDKSYNTFTNHAISDKKMNMF